MTTRLSFAISQQYAAAIASILISRRIKFEYSCWLRRSLGVFVITDLERVDTETLLILLSNVTPESLSHVSSSLEVDYFQVGAE